MRRRKPDPEVWRQLQTAAQMTAEKRRTARAHLDARYGPHGDVYARASERHALAVLDRAERRAWDRLYAYLSAISPRDWASTVPTTWIRDRLTFADATTRDALSVVPDPAYGYTEQDARAFAAAISDGRCGRCGGYLGDHGCVTVGCTAEEVS